MRMPGPCLYLLIITIACMDVRTQIGIVQELTSEKYPDHNAGYSVKFPDVDEVTRYVHSNLRLAARIRPGWTEAEVAIHPIQSQPI